MTQSGDQSQIDRRPAGRYVKLSYAVLADATWLRFAYFVITAIACAQTMFKSSFGSGAGALGGAALCYLSIATFVGSYRDRRDQSYSSKDLAGIGAIAAVLCGAGFTLMLWTRWRITIYGLVIPGFAWAILGIVIAIVTTKRKDVRGRRGLPTPSELSAAEVGKIIHGYAAVFANDRGVAMDSSALPDPKERIKRALALALRHTSDASVRRDLAAYYLGLADWQQGIGGSLAAFPVTESDLAGDVRVAAERISKAGAPFRKWLPIIEAERKQLLAELGSLLSPVEIEEMQTLIERSRQWLETLPGTGATGAAGTVALKASHE